MLKTKCIKAPKSPEDGVRVSVMSRHTLDDGITPDPEITKRMYDDWWTALAPPDRLIGAYYNGMPWEEFKKEFIEHLKKSSVRVHLRRLIGMARSVDVTILCIEEHPEKCHRRLIAEECERMDPGLEIEIK